MGWFNFKKNKKVSPEAGNESQGSGENVADVFASLAGEYLQKMDEVGDIEDTSPETANTFRQAVIDRVGYCNFGVMEIMGIVDARRMIGKSDSEIVDDLIRVQG
ncbi:MAG: hypothetical protein H8E17_16445 [Deltaproteobacteria bacterium]|nr:hypothetical protein [Deltaproteobacteria bacterium]